MKDKKEIKVNCYVHLFDNALNDKKLDLDCRVLYCYFHSLTNQGKCIDVSNDYLVVMLNSSLRNVTNKITFLVKHGYIRRKITRKKVDGKVTAYREITAINKYGVGVARSKEIEEQGANSAPSSGELKDQKANSALCQGANSASNIKDINNKATAATTTVNAAAVAFSFVVDKDVRVELSKAFEKHGIRKPLLRTLVDDAGGLTKERLVESLLHYVWDMEHCKRKNPIQNPPGFFRRMIEAEGYYEPPTGYKAPGEEKMLEEERLATEQRVKIERQRVKDHTQAVDKEIKEMNQFKSAFESWFKSDLTGTLRESILTTSQAVARLAQENKRIRVILVERKLCEEYFKENVY